MDKIIRCTIQLFINLCIFGVIIMFYIKLCIAKDFKSVLSNVIDDNKSFIKKLLKNKFSLISFFVCICLILFQVYLCFPGYGDWDTSGLIYGDFAGWRSISIPIVGFLLTHIFGANIAYLF